MTNSHPPDLWSILFPALGLSMASYDHVKVDKVILFGLMVLHVGATIFHLLRQRQNPIELIFASNKEVTSAPLGSTDPGATRSLALAILIGCALLVAWLVKLAV